MAFSLKLPNRSGNGAPEEIDISGNVVLVGANGSGKTRLGIWIEQHLENQISVHRISAQKALTIPDYAQLKNLKQAELDLMYGRSDQHASASRKTHDRWGGMPATFMLSDYDKLLSLLFAKSSERDRKSVDEMRHLQYYVTVPDSPIDTIVKIWGDIMPHREIRFSDGKILVHKNDEPEYHGKEMSDGERVALYMIGQSLCAPENSIIIVDEPEIHLHEALVGRVWNKIEELSQSKTLVYITHNLDFAASRLGATKLWIKSYDGKSSWEWDDVPTDASITESMILEIVGSRKKILFCEGKEGSLDRTVFEIVYPDYHIIPREGCNRVIEATKSLRNNATLHHMDAVGIIDRDYREAAEIDADMSHGIYTLPVAEIENLFCVGPILRLVAGHLLKDPDQVVKDVTNFVSSELKRELENQISSMAEKRIQYLLRAFSKSSNDKSGLLSGLKATLERIDIERIYAECEVEFSNALASNDLDDLLRVYNRKTLPNRISEIVGLSKEEYKNQVLRFMKGTMRLEFVAALQKYLPSLT